MQIGAKNSPWWGCFQLLGRFGAMPSRLLLWWELLAIPRFVPCTVSAGFCPLRGSGTLAATILARPAVDRQDPGAYYLRGGSGNIWQSAEHEVRFLLGWVCGYAACGQRYELIAGASILMRTAGERTFYRVLPEPSSIPLCASCAKRFSFLPCTISQNIPEASMR